MIKRGRAYKTSDAYDDINADHSLEGTDKQAITKEYLKYQVNVAQRSLENADNKYRLYKQHYGNAEDGEEEIEGKL